MTASTYKDRRTGLIVFGVIALIIGGFFALAAAFVPLGQWLAARRTGEPMAWSVTWTGVMFNLFLAATAIWLGIGSLLARRWSRPLILCISTMTLCLGAVECAVMPRFLGKALESTRQNGQPLPPHVMEIAKASALGMIVVCYVVLPALFVWFYRKPDVKLTVEARDPVRRWTDGCPLPLLAMCILLTAGAVNFLIMPRFFGGAFLLYGHVVSGTVARLLWLACGLFSLLAARGFYRRERGFWTATLIFFVLLQASNLITLRRVGLREIYQRMGLPSQQITRLAAMGFFGHAIQWLSFLALLAGLAFLLYVRRYFPETSGGAPDESGSAKAM